MKGTTPLTPLPDDFKSRLRAVDPTLTDYLYSAETYDAVVIAALAAQLAGSTDPADIAKQIVGVTNDGQRCDDPASCLALARNGQDIEYRGVSLTRAGFTDTGEPATASYATLHFDAAADRRRQDRVRRRGRRVGGEHQDAAEAEEAARRAATPSRTPLVLGGLLPKTGDLAHRVPADGRRRRAGDQGDQRRRWRARQAGDVDRRRRRHQPDGRQGDGGQARHGQACTSSSAPAARASPARCCRTWWQAGKILFSPSNTDAGLTTVDDKGLYFRTAPPDSLQGRALADVILRDGSQQDRHRGPQGLVRRGPAGHRPRRAGAGRHRRRPGQAADVRAAGRRQGAAGRLQRLARQEIKEFGADAVLIIGFGESAQVIEALADAGVQIGQ